ncbi:MAG: hypothetical protein IMW89_22470, partial [Ktedonobacteraceae bacterium]|nr:hypothetical protein [Ktedonobacteraceae bacterium]
TPTSGSGGNTPSTPARTPLALPKAMIPAGSQLYGTNWPGPGCDQQAQAATWSKTPNASLTCNADATKLTNTGGAPASVVLQTLPAGKAYPGDYIIQVQVDIRADSRGAFGVSFRNQPGNQPGKLAFLITPSGQWQASVYDNTTGTASVLPGASNAIFGSSMAQGRLTGTITIDVVVQKDTFTLYVNGERQGGAQSPLYPNGTIGLVADAGAVVYYKNLTVYALS